MGRHNGTWSPIYGQAWTHPKTARAATIAISAGHKRRYAPFLVLGWVHRLNIWCLANNEDGIVSSLSDVGLAAAVWPEGIEDGIPPARAGATIREALRAGGFLETSPHGERVHEFRDFHSRLLGDRAYQRKRDEESDDHSYDKSSDHSSDRSSDASGAIGTGTGTQDKKNPPTPQGVGAGAPLPALAEAWNRIAVPAGLPRVERLSAARARHVKARLVDEPDIAVWERAFRAIAADKFCSGHNDRGWRATFDYALRPEKCGRWLDLAREQAAQPAPLPPDAPLPDLEERRQRLVDLRARLAAIDARKSQHG